MLVVVSVIVAVVHGSIAVAVAGLVGAVEGASVHVVEVVVVATKARVRVRLRKEKAVDK